eukprot:TRINITY_DN1159_c0_g1_i3.p1 TRINITY_DN1159_c0_g1~~TRINITY_DN1159_c0_g1_i3.p1  ORF type:complete len:350 (+),score=99.38 TRINITY_DN1159_c0_g1_i3:120-1169(+)
MDLPVFDVADFLKDPNSPEVLETCKKMAESMHLSGVLIIRDPRVTMEDNEAFINTMEKYFGQPDQTKLADARPDIHYQVGATPEKVEVPRCSQEPECLDRISAMPEQHRPHPPSGPDPKERFFWRMGEPPKQTKFPELNAAPVIPKDFPEWNTVMNTWGTKMLEGVTSAAQMLSLGLDLGINAFSDMMIGAPHLLAPTGTNLEKYSGIDTIVAGFHYDLSFLTIHGKSRFPGLFIWLRTGEKMQVRVPDGCLLIQGGKQLEILTGGYIAAGDHEVVVSEDTLKRIDVAKNDGKSLWRVSSTLFSHIASDQLLKPLGKFSTDESKKLYPETLAGDQVQAELNMIKLAKQS